METVSNFTSLEGFPLCWTLAISLVLSQVQVLTMHACLGLGLQFWLLSPS